MCRHNVRSLNLNMHVPEQIKQTTGCNVAMAGSICIINNSYHETFFMKFSAVLSAIRACDKGANIEKVRVCFACKCNTPTTVIVKHTWFWCCRQNVGGCIALHTRAHELRRESYKITLNKCLFFYFFFFFVKPTFPRLCFGKLQVWHEVVSLACCIISTWGPTLWQSNKWDTVERVWTVLLFIL